MLTDQIVKIFYANVILYEKLIYCRLNFLGSCCNWRIIIIGIRLFLWMGKDGFCGNAHYDIRCIYLITHIGYGPSSISRIDDMSSRFLVSRTPSLQ